MTKKRKISVRKVIQLALTVVMAVCCTIAIVSASRIEGGQPLKAPPVVHISNDRKYQFIEQQEVMKLAIHDRHVDIAHVPVSRIDTRGIEKAIMSDPWVADARVFIGADRIMHIYVTQRVPVARLFWNSGSSCYMDSTLHLMPLSENYTYYAPVVTNVPKVKRDSAGLAVMGRIWTMVSAVRMDSFWNAQVSHIVMDTAGEFELVPVLGNHCIRFGDTSGVDVKLNNLMAFYRNVLNRIGWDKYQVLDVRFNGQVVASPSIPYHIKDAAFNRMNWVASMKAAREQSRQSDSIKLVSRIAAQQAAEQLTAAAQAQQAARKGKKGGKKADGKNEERLKGKEALDKVHKSLKSEQRRKGHQKKSTSAKHKETGSNNGARHQSKTSDPKKKSSAPVKDKAKSKHQDNKAGKKKDDSKKESSKKEPKYTYPGKK